MVFNEIYGAYYKAVARIIKKSQEHKLTRRELESIISENAFSESVVNIEDAIISQRWQLINTDGTTPIQNNPTMPLSDIEKSWLNAIANDKKVKLFEDEIKTFDDVKPLFKNEDIVYFDQCADGDPYENGEYIKNFRLILDAIRHKYLLDIKLKTRKGYIKRSIIKPLKLEYSQKDNKFRLIGIENNMQTIINLARILSCEEYLGDYDKSNYIKAEIKKETVYLEVLDKRDAMQRALLHFADFEKEAKRKEDNNYTIMIKYDKDDEMELLIRILSFGPMIKVVSPDRFVELIKERLINQKKL